MHFDHFRKPCRAKVLGLTTLLLGLAACSSNAADPIQQKLPAVEVTVRNYRVNAELANSNQTRQIGLMNRSHLERNSGMLFVFKNSESQCMWMKNTLIDLDVAFADEQGKILNVEQMKAGTTNIHCSKGDAKLALEMNLNWFSERNISTGDQLKVPERALLAQ